MKNGYEALWLYFGLSYASWLTMPRVMMHEMPDDWQAKMADLLREWEETWDTSHLPGTMVIGVGEKGKFKKFPAAILNYRRPDKCFINSLKTNRE